MNAREADLFENPMLLKCFQIHRLFLSDQLSQARRFKDELFDLPERIYHTFKSLFQILVHNQAYPCIRHVKDGVTAFG